MPLACARATPAASVQLNVGVRPHMPRAVIVSTEGPWLEAVVDVGGELFTVMDEFSLDTENCPKPGDTVEYQFSPLLLEDESWESIFSGNPTKKKGLERIDSWMYRAFGFVVSVDPVIVDCGLLSVEEVVSTNDDRVIGEYLAFTISRLGGYAYAA